MCLWPLSAQISLANLSVYSNESHAVKKKEEEISIQLKRITLLLQTMLPLELLAKQGKSYLYWRLKSKKEFEMDYVKLLKIIYS